MSKALSVDLRVRVLAAVASGLSHRQAGEGRERQNGEGLSKAEGHASIISRRIMAFLLRDCHAGKPVAARVSRRPLGEGREVA